MDVLNEENPMEHEQDDFDQLPDFLDPSSDEGFFLTPPISGHESSNNDENWNPDLGFISVDEVFETDEEDVLDRINRQNENSIHHIVSDSDDEESASGSIEDFVSSLGSVSHISMEKFESVFVSDCDSGEEADDEDEDDGKDDGGS